MNLSHIIAAPFATSQATNTGTKSNMRIQSQKLRQKTDRDLRSSFPFDFILTGAQKSFSV